ETVPQTRLVSVRAMACRFDSSTFSVGDISPSSLSGTSRHSTFPTSPTTPCGHIPSCVQRIQLRSPMALSLTPMDMPIAPMGSPMRHSSWYALTDISASPEEASIQARSSTTCVVSLADNASKRFTNCNNCVILLKEQSSLFQEGVTDASYSAGTQSHG